MTPRTETEAGRAMYRWFRGHDEMTGNRLDIETARRIRAIEDEAGPLDEAWRAAEAALPEGWCNGPTLFGYDVQGGGRFYVANVVAPKPYPRARQKTLIGDGPTPDAALQALAAVLGGHDDTPD